MSTVVVLHRAQMGEGDPELGRKVLANFLRKSPAMSALDAIVFYGEAVTLLAAGSPVLTELTLLEERGVDLHPCGTCVDHLDLDLAVGEVSSMDAIVELLDHAEKVITL